MKNKKPVLWHHPFVGRWMKKLSLKLSDTYTEFGYAVGPGSGRYPKDFLFAFDDFGKDIERLNLIYGTSFDDNFLDVRLRGCNTLREVIEQTSEVNRAIIILLELGTKDRKIYVGGLRFPKGDYFYLESNRLSSELKKEYDQHDMRSECLHFPTFIPVAKKYRPNFMK